VIERERQEHPVRAGWDRYDAALVVVAAIATVAVHPVRSMLSHQFWLDEAWVAVLTRASFSELVHLKAPVPAGFVALLDLVPGSGMQRARLVVLLFSVLTVVVAYALTRSLAWPSRSIGRGAGIVAALVVMLAPLSLVRNDLKQYGCDAFCALVVLAVGAWADREHERRRLFWLAATSIVVLPFSWAAMFVVVAVFTGLLASALVERSRPRALEVIVVGGGVGVVLAAFFAVLVLPKLNDRLHTYWRLYYLNGSPIDIVRSSWDRLTHLQHDLAMPALVFIAFFAFGVVVLWRMRERALAIAVVALWAELFLAARLQKYPFLNLRISQFLLVSSLVIVAIGAFGLVRICARLHVAAAIVVGVCIAALFSAGTLQYFYTMPGGTEDVRAQAVYVATHRGPHDVIIVNESANFGFAYYWPHGHVAFHGDDSGQGFAARAVGVGAFYVPDESYTSVFLTLQTAVKRWRAAGPDSRLFIVRTHVDAAERGAWRRAFLRLDVLNDRHKERVGPEALVILMKR
jgi:MFS family permease